MRKRYFLAALLFPLFSFSQQQAKSISYAGQQIGFWEHLPADYNAGGETNYPLLIFLHGIGERGNGSSDLWKVKRLAVPHYIDEGNPMKFYVNGTWFSFIVLSPQCPLAYTEWPTSYVDALIGYAETNLHVDRSRIYLAGLSMGGGGTLAYASASAPNATRLAAIATSSAPNYMSAGCNIANAKLPLYAFHATDDPVVNVSSIYTIVNIINQCHPTIKPIEKVWLTGGHNIYDRSFDVGHTYQTPNVYEWMLQYSRNVSGGSSQAGSLPDQNKPPVANAGADQVIQLSWNYAPLLNATLSKDPDGWITSVQWTKVSGPSSSTILAPASLQTRVQNLSAGNYVFRATIKDNKGATAYDDVSIFVNTPPEIKVTGPSSVTLPVTWAFLQASGSTDPMGYIMSFNWSKVSGPACTVVDPYKADCHFYNLVPGTYVFRIIETDAEGGKSIKDVSLQVNAANTAYASGAVLDTTSIAAQNQLVGAQRKLSIYPNPATSNPNVAFNGWETGRAKLSLYDMSGKLVQVITVNSSMQSIDVSGLRAGTYVVVASVDNKILATQRLQKQ